MMGRHDDASRLVSECMDIMSRFDKHRQSKTQIIQNKLNGNTQGRITKPESLEFHIGWQKGGNILAVRNQIAGHSGRNMRVS